MKKNYGALAAMFGAALMMGGPSSGGNNSMMVENHNAIVNERIPFKIHKKRTPLGGGVSITRETSVCYCCSEAQEAHQPPAPQSQAPQKTNQK